MARPYATWEFGNYQGVYDGEKYGSIEQFDMQARVDSVGIDRVIDQSCFYTPTDTGSFTIPNVEKVLSPFIRDEEQYKIGMVFFMEALNSQGLIITPLFLQNIVI